ncbi:putative sporulation protein YtaF [Lentibacillus halodurans]|uniref:Putative sporulation protein YtaF n=1 Tax=Lentibacillus halodurans TaxID=237679 RepID=A0A1I1A3W3_9BACI|nr:sporulation membrane protein YtaF [Lentibacillus halodurans]SFB32617.1 putative sporulation protein YtaF [Lentibacillus halodurans]
MLYYTGLILLIIGVSIDGFGVGMSYGIRRVHVPYTALGIIMFCSGLIVYISMIIGNTLKSFITPNLTDNIGGIILLLIGVYCLYNVIRSKQDTHLAAVSDDATWDHFKTVMREPQQADLDESGSISLTEAILLGFALAIDAFGAGLGAAMLGYSPVITALSIALMSGLFVLCGIRFGMFLSATKWMKQLTLLPPFLLIILGIFNMI